MECRKHCGACCIAPSINQPFYGMPQGKKAGVACVHLTDEFACKLFQDPRRPDCCAAFQAEPSVCGNDRDQALIRLQSLEDETLTTP